jgi:glutaminase
LSEIAATLSNGGINPFNEQSVLSKTNVEHIFKSLEECGYTK